MANEHTIKLFSDLQKKEYYERKNNVSTAV